MATAKAPAVVRGVSSAAAAVIVKQLRGSAFYDAAQKGGDIEIRGVLPSPPSMTAHHLVDSGKVDPKALATTAAWLASYKYKIGGPGLDMDDFRDGMLKAFPTGKDIGTRLYKLKIPFFYSSPTQFKEVVEHLAPHLVKLSEVSDVWFVTRSTIPLTRLASIRALYAAQHIPELLKGSKSEFKGFNTLQHLDSTDDLGVSDKLNLFFALFSPYFCGSSMDRVGGTVAFILPELKEFRTPFPPRVQDVLRTDLSPFAEDKELEALERGVHISFSKNQLNGLFARYAENLCRLEDALLEPTRFVLPDGTLNTRRWFLSHLTVERLFRDTLIIQMEYLSQYLRKMLAFHFLDAVSQTMKQHPRFAADPKWTETRIFKTLLSQRTIIEGLGSRLTKYPAPFGNYFRNSARRIGRELHEKTLEGVFVSGRRAGDQVTVAGSKVSLDDYVTSFLREVRNTHHGYNINKFEVLEIHDGNLPDCLTDIPVLFLLALIQDPDMLFETSLIP